MFRNRLGQVAHLESSGNGDGDNIDTSGRGLYSESVEKISPTEKGMRELIGAVEEASSDRSQRGISPKPPLERALRTLGNSGEGFRPKISADKGALRHSASLQGRSTGEPLELGKLRSEQTMKGKLLGQTLLELASNEASKTSKNLSRISIRNMIHEEESRSSPVKGQEKKKMQIEHKIMLPSLSTLNFSESGEFDVEAAMGNGSAGYFQSSFSNNIPQQHPIHLPPNVEALRLSLLHDLSTIPYFKSKHGVSIPVVGVSISPSKPSKSGNLSNILSKNPIGPKTSSRPFLQPRISNRSSSHINRGDPRPLSPLKPKNLFPRDPIPSTQCENFTPGSGYRNSSVHYGTLSNDKRKRDGPSGNISCLADRNAKRLLLAVDSVNQGAGVNQGSRARSFSYFPFGNTVPSLATRHPSAYDQMYTLPRPRDAYKPQIPCIVPVLANSDLWKTFHKFTNEMIVTRTGRCLFPNIAFTVSFNYPQMKVEASKGGDAANIAIELNRKRGTGLHSHPSLEELSANTVGTDLYYFGLVLRKTSHLRYRWENNGWCIKRTEVPSIETCSPGNAFQCGSNSSITPSNVFVHPQSSNGIPVVLPEQVYFAREGPREPAYWESHGISFLHFKVTNSDDGNGNSALGSQSSSAVDMYSFIPLETQYKYQGILRVYKVRKLKFPRRQSSSLDPTLYEHPILADYSVLAVDDHPFPELEFVVVTHYRNPEIIKLKKTFNPHAKGLRNSLPFPVGEEDLS